MTIKLWVASKDDRDKMTIALANSSHKVWVEEISNGINYEYLVCFEVADHEIMGGNNG